MIEIPRKSPDIFAIDRKIQGILELSISDCFSGAQVATILQHGGGKAARGMDHSHHSTFQPTNQAAPPSHHPHKPN
ncbi:unnamed protein product [Prunus brigantina]